MRKNKLFLLLALLLTAATGAWADETPLLTIESTDYTSFRSGSMTFDDKVTITFSNPVTNTGNTRGWYANPTETLLTVTGTNGYTITSCKFYAETGAAATGYTVEGESPSVYLYSKKVFTDDSKSVEIGQRGIMKIEVFGTAASSGYTVSMKDGVKDADKWTVKVGDGQAQALPIGGLKGDGSETVTLQYNGRLKVKGVKATSEAAATDEPEVTYTLLSAATTADCGKVVCAAGHLHDAKTAVPTGCTAVGILGKVTETGHGLILALQDAAQQKWNTINGWTSVTTYAGTTLKVLTDDARGTNLTSYTALGETAVSNWAVAQKSDYEAIFTNLGTTTGDSDGMTYDGNVNAYITTGVGGTAMSNSYWSATGYDDDFAWYFNSYFWNYNAYKEESYKFRPVLGFGGEAGAPAKTPATVTTAPTGAAVVGVGKTTALVSGGAAEGGTMMYKVTTENTKPASTDGFSADVPTAQGITASGKVYVWYYVKGDPTHSDSEIAATAIEVPVADIVWDATNVFNSSHKFDKTDKWDPDPLTYEGITISVSGEEVSTFTAYDPMTQTGLLLCYGDEGDSFTFTAPQGKMFCKIEIIVNKSISFEDYGDWTSDETGKKFVWSGTAANAVTLGTVFTSANNLNSIAFYLSK